MKKDMIEKILLKKDWQTSSYNNVNNEAVLYYLLMKRKTFTKDKLDILCYSSFKYCN